MFIGISFVLHLPPLPDLFGLFFLIIIFFFFFFFSTGLILGFFVFFIFQFTPPPQDYFTVAHPFYSEMADAGIPSWVYDAIKIVYSGPRYLHKHTEKVGPDWASSR